jgi:hypothetical protein
MQKMIPTETTLGIGGGGDKGEWLRKWLVYDIFDTL